MCSPLRERCIQCPTSWQWARTYKAMGIIVKEKCCTDCKDVEDGKTRYEMKVEAYRQGLYHHNPCNECNQYDKCGEQLRRGFITDSVTLEGPSGPVQTYSLNS